MNRRTVLKYTTTALFGALGWASSGCDGESGEAGPPAQDEGASSATKPEEKSGVNQSAQPKR